MKFFSRFFVRRDNNLTTALLSAVAVPARLAHIDVDGGEARPGERDPVAGATDAGNLWQYRSPNGPARQKAQAQLAAQNSGKGCKALLQPVPPSKRPPNSN
jgi:hypothetical protein